METATPHVREADPAAAPRPASTRGTRAVGTGAALVVASTLVWHMSNFAFNSVAARVLGPPAYGVLAAVIALLYLATPVVVSVQTVASRITTSLTGGGESARVRGLLRWYSIRFALGGLMVAVATALCASAIARFLRIDSPAPIALLGIAIGVTVVTHLQRGVLQGAMAFGRYSISTAVEALVKVGGAAVLLLLVSKSVNAAVAAVVASALVAVVANSALLRFLPRPDGPVDPIPHPYRYSLLTLGTFVALSALLSIDVLATKRYLDPHDAGLYAAVSLGGKIVFFATSALSFALFPYFSEQRDRRVDGRSTLAQALAVVAGGSTAIVAVYLALPHLVVGTLFGSRFDAAQHHIALMAVACGFYAVAYLAAMYLLSQGRGASLVVLAWATLAQLGALYAFHASIDDVIVVELVVFAATAAVLVAMAFAPRRLRVEAAPQ